MTKTLRNLTPKVTQVVLNMLPFQSNYAIKVPVKSWWALLIYADERAWTWKTFLVYLHSSKSQSTPRLIFTYKSNRPDHRGHLRRLTHSPGSRFTVNWLQTDAVVLVFTGDDGNLEQLFGLQWTSTSHYINQWSGPLPEPLQVTIQMQNSPQEVLSDIHL